METTGKPLKVLVVDDEPLIAMSITFMLEDLGHQAVSANSGKEALELLGDDGSFDLLITDHLMPDMSGTELARQVMGRHAQLTVFLSTGYSEVEGDLDRSLPRLHKPYTLNDLEALIAAKFAGRTGS
jgi:CheY-like chemotaxis protein